MNDWPNAVLGAADLASAPIFAGWLDDGAIYLNDPVQDVSANNDWSQVRVYNIKTGGWGSRIYPVQGFIGGSDPGSDVPDLSNLPSPSRPDLVARVEAQE